MRTNEILLITILVLVIVVLVFVIYEIYLIHREQKNINKLNHKHKKTDDKDTVKTFRPTNVNAPKLNSNGTVPKASYEKELLDNILEDPRTGDYLYDGKYRDFAELAKQQMIDPTILANQKNYIAQVNVARRTSANKPDGIEMGNYLNTLGFRTGSVRAPKNHGIMATVTEIDGEDIARTQGNHYQRMMGYGGDDLKN